ncbi:hydroxymethylglutaryl-CoA lyase [Sansalvadorimonas sp. 2012CJ34-2]|uniref:Hydroxymethylglutaryl-CoA lyase n=1 Tax=Parendozoicomonas callyspongiae TaxID=2942213 RepID=A0ABT0PF98_9GAMM|nr:hydroxymethylglutaryl-CoA lyase [Sansalvadorimonas sp. 2012CJ34-2]MCL6269896.1 hydroxymethylglutaryl-CoA lyase [Sansalvadorimonas sp. 2012CJ34-2]
MSLPEAVTLVEVGPRDGLQGQPVTLSVEDRVALITMLAKAGLSRIEAGSFVSPTRIPPMRDSGKVLSGLKESSARYCVLTPNMRGLNDALAAGAQEVAVFTGVSETFVQKNIHCSIAESMARFQPVVEAAKDAGVLVRGYLSCTMGCPYEGETDLNAVAHIARDLYQMGCYEISMGDTIGVGNPVRVQKMIELAGRDIPVPALAVHFHDTYGQAIANIYAAMESGISVIDTAVAGLGGCPYAKGASGNVATEDVLFMLNGMGIHTGVDMDALLQVNQQVCSKLGCSNYSRTAQALLSKK